MPTLQVVHGRIVDLRRYTNVHLYYGRRPFGPTDRYELWIKPHDGAERKFTINTRTMPARRGHEVSLIATAHPVPQVLGLANWTTIDGVNYARTDALPLLRVGDFVVLSAAFLATAILYGARGMVLFVPAAVAYLPGGRPRAGPGTDAAGCPGGPGHRRRGAADEPIPADAAVTIRFGDQARLASRDRFRLMLLIERDPGDIVSFAQLQALMQQHRVKVRGVSREAEFLRWLMDREWNRLAPGSGYRKPL
ncbi:MAG: hypothetical protein KF710_02075 [Rhodocyclaceae bacterium]|nr:hypothetical protein [Rhodocyclaceae bacterium]